MTPATTFLASTPWRRSARTIAFVAVAFCLFVVATIFMAVGQDRRESPLNSPEIAALKTQLLERPNDAKLKDAIRLRDQQLRQGYFMRNRMVYQGAWLLVGGGAALAISLKSFWRLSKRPPEIAEERVDVWREHRQARWGVGISGVVLAGTMVLWAVMPVARFPDRHVMEIPVWKFPTWDEQYANWPAFRGAEGNGIVRQPRPLPQEWDGPAGKGIVWKSLVPLPGHSSPIVWAGRVFLSGATDKAREVFCYEAASGKLLWRESVPSSLTEMPSVFEDTGHAAATMVSDGNAVFAIFATADLAAFDFAGKRLWTRSLGNPESIYGYAASLAMSAGKVIVQFDQGSAAEDGKSALLALDGQTGKTIWKIKRPVNNSWSSPVVVPTPAGDQIITCGAPWVIAYDAKTGTEIWKASLLDGDVAITPVYHDGTVYIANDRATAAAIKADSKGDVTATAVLWTMQEGLPDISSPVVDGKRMLMATGSGLLTCLDAAKGTKLWEFELQKMVHASPLLVGDVVYLTDVGGVTHQFKLDGSAFKEIRVCPLGEPVSASLAVSGDHLFIRGRENLYCIGAAP